MNFKAPDFSEFGKWCASPTGIVVISLILLVGYATFKKQREGSAPKLTPEASLPQAPQSSFSKVELPNDPFSRPSTPVDNHRSIEVEKRPPVVILPISLYNSLGDDLGEINAPYGRFIKCKLVNTVDSARIDTPIVGLVLEDVLKPGSYGEVIIPAGTEVHGTATMIVLVIELPLNLIGSSYGQMEPAVN